MVLLKEYLVLYGKFKSEKRHRKYSMNRGTKQNFLIIVVYWNRCCSYTLKTKQPSDLDIIKHVITYAAIRRTFDIYMARLNLKLHRKYFMNTVSVEIIISNQMKEELYERLVLE